MNQEEQAAFVTAYRRHIKNLPEDHIKEFVAKWFGEELVNYEVEQYPLVDALYMWQRAKEYYKQNQPITQGG